MGEDLLLRPIRRGEIYYVKGTDAVGCEQQTQRPAVIVSNNLNNRYCKTVEVVFLTRSKSKKPLPTHVLVDCAGCKSTALCEQITTCSKERLGAFVDAIDDETTKKIDVALKVSLGL